MPSAARTLRRAVGAICIFIASAGAILGTFMALAALVILWLYADGQLEKDSAAYYGIASAVFALAAVLAALLFLMFYYLLWYWEQNKWRFWASLTQ